MRKTSILALGAATAMFLPTLVLAQGTGTAESRARLEAECSKRPAGNECIELKRRMDRIEQQGQVAPGPNTPGGDPASSESTSGAGAGGVTPGGNPAQSGGSPRSSQ